jgi:NTE family protein
MINAETIGFRIDRKEQMENDALGKGLAAMPVNNMGDYLAAFYNIIIENLNRQSLTPDDWKRTVSISDGDLSPRIRKLSDVEIETLISNGAKATGRFLK